MALDCHCGVGWDMDKNYEWDRLPVPIGELSLSLLKPVYYAGIDPARIINDPAGWVGFLIDSTTTAVKEPENKLGSTV
jgi:hypothetical protein